MKFLQNIPPYLFFTGKGGVGKTSISCATAIRLAGRGKRVLLVSTDPASNVGQVFDQTIGNTIHSVNAVPLWRLTHRKLPSSIAPESLILLRGFCLMTSLTASASSFPAPVRLRLRRSMSSPVY